MSAVPQTFPRATSWYRCAVALNGSLALALAAAWLSMAARGLFWRADFSAFYTGWSLLRDGHGARLYDLELQDAYQRAVLPERPPGEGLLPFVNPPHAALALAPLSLLPRPAAFYVWAAFQVGLCLLAARFLAALAAGWGDRPRRLMLLTALAFPPLFITFQMGQVSLLCFVCLLGFVGGLQRGGAWRTAGWVVLGTVKPQLMVVPCVVLAGQRRWRELGCVAALAAACAALTAALLGWRCWADYLEVTRFAARQFGTSGIDPLRMYNLKGLLTGVLGAGRGELINALTAAGLLAAVLASWWLWRRPCPPGAPDFDLRLGLTALIGLACNPHFNSADAVTLVLPGLLLFGYVRRGGRAAALATLLIACPLLFFADCYLLSPDKVPVRPFFLLMLAVAAGMAYALARGSESRVQTLSLTA